MIEQVGKDKGIDKETLIEAIKSAMLKAMDKKFRGSRDLEAQYNDETGEIEIYEFVTVVEDVEDSYMEITLEEAHEYDPEAEIGDSLGIKMDSSDLGRIAAQTAKQVIIQKLREAERENIYNEFKTRKCEIVNGTVQRFENRDIIVNLGKTDAILPYEEQIPRESYRRGERIRAYIQDVRQAPKGPQVILSRASSGFLCALFEMEVPEIYEGLVTIKAVARETGSRAKISVASNDNDIDPVGACVGTRGSRVQSVVQELKGEKIDIVPWSDDPVTFACNAISPAEVGRVMVNKEEKKLIMIVPDDQLSLAIGKKGQNVRLVAKITGWRIDVKSESRLDKEALLSFTPINKLFDLDLSTLNILMDEGIQTVEELINTPIEKLAALKGIGEKRAEEITEILKRYLQLREEEQEVSEMEDALQAELSSSMQKKAGGAKEEENLRYSDAVKTLKGVGEKTSELISKEGFLTLKDILDSDPDTLATKTGISLKKATDIYEKAKVYVEEKAE
jgi:N utilization substance protein A